MSQAGRKAHAIHKAQHAQRDGEEKRTLQPVGTDTTWMGEFVSSIQGITTPFGVESVIALQLGDTREERIVRLRKLSALGVLHMSSRFENGHFVEFLWTLTEQGIL